MINNFFLKNIFLNIYEKPITSSIVISQILYGEEFKILSKKKNWIKIKTIFDNYIGYIKNPKFEEKFHATHKIFKLKSKIFTQSKNRKFNKTEQYLPFASKILILEKKGKFIKYDNKKWIQKKDVKKINHIEKNFLKILRLFVNTKYTWGGKNFKGIDCSAILQIFYYYNGYYFPRDTKDQIKYLKADNTRLVFKKGKIIFWKGHVAICINSKKLIHAYGPKKKVLIMPIKYTIKIIKQTADLKVKKICNIFN